MNKNKKKKILQRVLILVILFCGWNIAAYLYEEISSHSFSKNMQESVVEMGTEEVKESIEEIVIPESIDFDQLRSVNPDVVGWLYDPGMTINYAVVHTDNNDYYLTHRFDGVENKTGTLFADCRNDGDFSDWNTIIYGHNMKSGSMFASILDYQSQNYYEKHPVMYLYTPEQRYKIELIAGYATDVYDAIFVMPNTDEAKAGVLDRAYSSSTFQSDVIAGAEDTLVTFSTCFYSYDDARYVLIGKLVED